MTQDGTLRGERVELRPADERDVDAIASILSEPDVARWWGRYDSERVRAELAGSFVILVDGAAAGWLQAHEQADPDFPSVAFDIAVTARLSGRGVGREALRVAIRHFIERGHHRFTIDPALENDRAVRSYSAVGFKRVGVMRGYERRPDGSFRDGLLMDLLADDLVEGDRFSW
jgi:aminoglycoside 6'-N-acetyltransferase